MCRFNSLKSCKETFSVPSRLALLSFENYLLANRNTEKPVLHISLSPAPEDRLTDGRLAELAHLDKRTASSFRIY